MNVWAHVEERYQVGQQVRGTVTRIAQFGVFVQVEPGLEGIVYAFELGGGPSATAACAPGQEMQLYIKNIDASRRRLELSLDNAPMPGLLNEDALPPAARRQRLSLDNAPVPGLPDELMLSPTRRKSQSDALPWPGSPPLPDGQTGVHWIACPTCQRVLAPDWRFCVYCGGSLQRRCPACGSTQPDLPDARYCHACGRPIEARTKHLHEEI
jgi:hypothetical protein